MTEFKKTRDIINSFDRAIDPVKLAILDTGIDANHPWINEKWAIKWHKPPFYDFTTSTPYERMIPIDETGHGTQMAGIVLQFAQDVELYVIRVFETREFEGRSGSNAMEQVRKVRCSPLYVFLCI